MSPHLNRIILLILLLGPMAATASDGQWYIGVTGGISQLEPEISTNSTIVQDEDTDAAVKVFAGYDFTDNWSVEGFYSYLGEATFVPANTLDYQTYGLAGIYSWPDNRDGFSVFVKGGVNGIYNTSTLPIERVDDVQAYGGAGLEYHINDLLSVRLEADYYEEDALYAGVGLRFRFGGNYRQLSKPEAPEADDDFGPDFDAVETEHTPDVVDPIPAPEPQVYTPEPEPYVGPAPVIEPGISRVLEGVQFEFGSPRLTPESRSILNGVVRSLQQQPELRVKVDGHTDSVGNAAANRRLSLLRARSVAMYLVEQGIARNRVKYIGFGGDRPRADNSSEQGRALNRRVEILGY